MSDAGDEFEEGEPQYEIVFRDDPNNKDTVLRRDGTATAKFANNDTYVGAYANGKRHGFGTYTFANGAVYAGNYVNGQRQGKGTFRAPDKSVYEGEWVADKRHGQGKYTYPTGDVYEGTWKDGRKDGKGKYTYAKSQHVIVGDWSNGKLMQGEWQMHDGGKFIGKFDANAVPSGSGLHVHANGLKSGGQYVDGQWQAHQFTTPAPTEQPPAIVEASPLTSATRHIERSVLKLDHFEAIYRLKKEIEGVPNFRRVPDFPVFGCGQPTLSGFRKMMETVQEAGFSKVLWFNMRNEPVLYVADFSYAPRHPHHLNENMELPGLSIDDLHALEATLRAKAHQEATHRGGVHKYYKDTFAENPADRKNLHLEEHVADLSAIRDLSGVYAHLNEEDGFDISYERLPIVDEKSPSVADFDRMVQKLKGVEEGTAIVFNCQMGKGRTTTGNVVAVLMHRLKHGEPEKEEGEGGDDGGKDDAAQGGAGGGDGGDGDEEEAEDDDADGEQADGGDGSGSASDASVVSASAASAASAAPAASAASAGASSSDSSDANYSLIQRLLQTLPNASKAKTLVDDSMDRCRAMQHLRDCIQYAKAQYDKETVDRREFWKRMGVNFVERYYMLIAFATYLAERKEKADEEFEVSFAAWLAQHPEVLEALGTRDAGGLAEFHWN